jgi:hypothetical protein
MKPANELKAEFGIESGTAVLEPEAELGCVVSHSFVGNFEKLGSDTSSPSTLLNAPQQRDEPLSLVCETRGSTDMEIIVRSMQLLASHWVEHGKYRIQHASLRRRDSAF